METGGKSWWQWTDEGPDARPSKALHYSGWEPSLKLLVEAIRQHRCGEVWGGWGAHRQRRCREEWCRAFRQCRCGEGRRTLRCRACRQCGYGEG